MNLVCKYCNKIYASYSSRCNHIKKFHNSENELPHKSSSNPPLNSVPNSSTIPNTSNIKLNNLCCKYCNKEMSRSDNLKRHEKTCANKKDIIEELKKQSDDLKKHSDNLKKQNDKLKQELNEMKNMCKTNIKSKNVINGNVINGNVNNIVNNNVVNNIIIELGGECMKLLSEEQKLKVLKSINYGEYPIITLVEELFKNEKNRNIKISNLHDNIALKYDGDIEKFKATSKKHVINDIISVRKYDITKVFEEFCDTNKINDKTKASIEKYLIKLHNSSEKNNELKIFMNEHKEQIIFIIYNITLTE